MDIGRVKISFLLANAALIYPLPTENKNSAVRCAEHKDILAYTHCITKRNVNRCMGNSCVSCRNGGCQTTCTGTGCSSCPNGGCCNGNNCNICAGTSCCSSSTCNSCVNSCQLGCNSLKCQNSCVDQCQTCNSCQECCQSKVDNCFANCMNQCTTDECHISCIKNCIVPPMPERTSNTCDCSTPQPCCPNNNSSVDITNILKEQKAVNITTIINLKNYINNTNIVNNPINVTSHNINHIHLLQASKRTDLGRNTIVEVNKTCEKEKCPEKRCCYVIHPTHCYNIPEPPYVKCVRRRHYECSNICSSVVVHVVHVPKPYPVAFPVYRPICHYVQQYPWVQCGHYGVQDCGSCYYCGGRYNPRQCQSQTSCALLCRGDIFYKNRDTTFRNFIETNYPSYSACGPSCYANEPVGQTPIQIPYGVYMQPAAQGQVAQTPYNLPLQQGGCSQATGCPQSNIGPTFEQVHSIPQTRNMQ